ncbi:Ig-like domain-containing protein [Nocardioides sp.]|uniref:Ig-like domain-containing protein n=1 Tax=Nocardioides sp. TaxID=35761 RepID=UPI0039E565F3
MRVPRLSSLRSPGRRARRTRRIASGVSLAVAVSALVVLATRAEGTPISDVDLNDGSVWVTNQDPSRNLLGRLNAQIRQLDLAIQSDSGDFDVYQDGATVFLAVRSGGASLRRIDVAAGRANDPIELPATATTAFGGDTVAILDTETGAGWVRTADTVSGFTPELEPDVRVGRNGAVAVGEDGTAWFVNQGKHTVTPVAVTAGLPDPGEPRDLGAKVGTSLAVTAVGSSPVVLDRDTGVLLRPGADPLRVETDDPLSIRLQQPGPASDSFYVATRGDLLRGALDGGVLESVRGGFDGPPAAPLVHAGYVHAAWADPDAEAYVRVHGDDVHAEKIPGVAGSATLTFRRNRDVVVLNDTLSGVSWLVQEEGLPRVENWDDVDPKVKKEQQEDPDPQQEAKVRRTEENHPPIARDDVLGARPGQESILPVVRNDVDADGDILTVSSVEEIKHLGGPEPERVAIVGDGTQIQMQFGANDAGKEARFSYVVTDGREAGTDEAELRVQITPLEDNRPPELVKDGDVPRETAITLGRGQRTSLYVLPDWTDADGDALVLQSATAKSGTVTFRPEGVIDYTDDGKAGTKTIDISVSDGHGDGVTSGKVTVNVNQSTAVPPALVPDRAVGLAGSWIQVAPLANDSSRDGTALHLRDVPGLGGVDIQQDPLTGLFQARSSQPGTYYLDYGAYTDRAEAQSFVRLDVLKKSETNLPPVAMRDEGLIPPGGHALLDLLANDTDPEAGVLAVTSVSVPPGSGVKASLLRNRLLRVETARDLTAPVSIGYTVTDGPNTTAGTVTVGQGTLTVANRPPVAADDKVTVRAGAVGSVAVLGNDVDPDGDDLLLLQQDLVKPEDLALFVSGTRLRFKAPDQAGEYRITYGVRDARGQRDDAEVVITVKPDDPEDNAAPRPEAVEARAIGDRAVRIELGLSGSDPDGDAVTLSGLVSAPQLGRVVNTGLDWIEYQPFDEATGTDVFEAEVHDRYGARGVVPIRVGVAPRAATNQSPVALDDQLAVRPDRVIAYNVLTNDADPDGDPPLLSEDLKLGEGTTASLEDDFVVVTVPPVEGAAKAQTTLSYEINDELGAMDTARFTIDASADAPLYAPTTRDDVAALAQIAGKTPGETITVDVLDNDGDLDGRREDLRIEAWDPRVSSVVDDKLNVVLAAEDQVVVYRVLDAEDQESFGFVFVSGTDDVPPVLDPTTVPVEMKAGESREIALADHVLVRAGRSPIVTVPDAVETAPFAGGVEVTALDRMVITAPADFVGRASVTFEVTDGADLNDATGLTSLLTIPIDVIATRNEPPTLRDVDVQLVGGDEAEEKRIDLAAAAADANAEDLPRLAFTAQSTDKVEARVEDRATLVLKAKDGVADLDVSDVPLTVTDPGGASGKGTAHVTIVSSDKPLVTVSQIGPLEAEAGAPVSFDIGDYAVNPYEGEPLTVSDAVVESGEGAAKAAGSGVTVTSAARFAGTITVRFVVHDGSGRPDRDVTARAEIVVVAAPDPPGRPAVSSATHDSVTLNWTPADDKGAPVEKYVVAWSGGSRDCGAATTCEVTGLTPGQTYQFTVTAHNRVGPSEPSPASESVTPDRVPEMMAAPTVVQDYLHRDGQLELTWTPPQNVGSPIKFYEIALLGTAEARTVAAGTTSFQWNGLTNGEMRQFRIRAVNDIVEEARKQAWSEASQPDKAFGVPAVVAKPTAVASADDGVAGGIVTVSWSAPDDNGDDLDGYQVTMNVDGAAQSPKQVSGTQTVFNVDNGHDYTFTVQASNRAGLSEPSDPSDKVNPYDKSSEVRNLTKVSEGDSTARISWDAPADDGGRDIVEYRVTSTGGPAKTVGAGTTTADVTFSANNGPYTVTVKPVTRDDQAGEILGKSADVGGVRPFGTPAQPTNITASGGYMSVGFSWGTPAANGRPVLAVQYQDGSSWTTATSKTISTTQGGDQACIKVRTVSEGATSTDRLYSDVAQKCGNADARTVEAILTSVSAPAGNCDTPDVRLGGTCRVLSVAVTGFAPGSYTITENATNWSSQTMTVGSDGRGDGGGPPWYTGLCETYVVTVDGISDSVTSC